MHFPAFDDFYQRLLFLLPFATNFGTVERKFNYVDSNKWHETFPLCGGAEQSPIAISRHKVIPIGLPPLQFAGYDELFQDLLRIQNSGHTVNFAIPPTVFGERPSVTGGLLQDFYEAREVHFHWGSQQSKGSEHLLNGRRYDLEMHIVHRNTKYSTTEEARNNTDGLAVLAVLFKVVRTGPSFYQPGLTEIFGSLLHLGRLQQHLCTSSSDHTRIALEQSGSGELLLLQGFADNAALFALCAVARVCRGAAHLPPGSAKVLATAEPPWPTIAKQLPATTVAGDATGLPSAASRSVALDIMVK
ncbi:GL23343 [Drosophila persimilis]|uniref:Carbonic anhydrase n=1 Tax=Drosophila persimilis TaxID=7234 RepID=B4G4M9_DROPE|nr:GL23343 [Drosophila persimilis]